MGISCSFTQRNTGTKFQLTVYRRQKDKLYMLNDGDTDFKLCDVNSVYLITVTLNGKQNASLKKRCDRFSKL
jgi:hypothetical protein